MSGERTPGEMNLEEALKVLGDLLEREREALLKGDAAQVQALSVEKADVAAAIEEADQDEDRREIMALARKVGDLARANHALIEQMQRHYNGMIELFMRMAGQTTIYGPTGAKNDIGLLGGTGQSFTA